jgi:hypothetical protein
LTEDELRQRICACARSWLGRREADGSFRPIIDTYNQIRPLPGGYRMSYADPWCAAFVSACGWAVGLSEIIYPECSCDRMIDLYRQHGRWCEDDAYHAEPGDVIFYDWQDSGAGDNRGSSDHVGLVVEDNGHYMTIIEGNHSDAVSKRTLAYNSQFIRGFGLPDYAAMGDQETDAGQLPADPQPEPYPAPVMFSMTLPQLQEGDVGQTVKAVQAMLISEGFRCGPWANDGEFGPDTKSAVQRFQRSRGLTQDGIIGPETFRALLGVMA